jgi:hypothetical protein
MIKEINGWWYLVNAGAFHGYPFPTKADAEEALASLKEAQNEMVECLPDPHAPAFGRG